MKPLRVAHLSDTHLGYRALAISDPRTGRNQRSVDIERAFDWVIDDLLGRDIDVVIHSGDLFHHARPAYPAIGAAIRQFRRLEKAGVPTVVIGGNHDTPRLRTSGSVYWVLESALPDIRFCTGYEECLEQFNELDLALTLIPHGRLADPVPPSVYPEANKRNVLVTHGLAPNVDIRFRGREPGEEEIGEYLLDETFDYIALGHFHQFGQIRPNAWYAGSTERMGWGDAELEPGYVIATLAEPGTAAAVERVLIPDLRPMCIYTVPESFAVNQDGVRIANNVIDWLKELGEPEAMTRIVMKGIARPARRQAEALIRQESEQYVWSVQVASSADFISPLQERNHDLPSVNLLDMFSTFVTEGREEGRYDLDFAVKFGATGRKVLEQAQHQLEAQLTTEGGG